LQPDVITICVDPSTWLAQRLLNANKWRPESKDVIHSAGAQLSLLLHASRLAAVEVSAGRDLCGLRVRDLQKQWRVGRWDLHRSRYFVESPNTHLTVQAFLSSGKTLLDLLAQLTWTEKLLAKKVHGFHKKGEDPDGELLGFLLTRQAVGRKSQAEALHSFLKAEKAAWLDGLVQARDFLAHPHQGMVQIMWELELAEAEDTLIAREMAPPSIMGSPFHDYMARTAERLRDMVERYLALVKVA